MDFKPIRWTKLEPGPSKIEDALTEITRALVDLQGPAKRTTKAQSHRAHMAIAYLSELANFCHYGHYNLIEKLDKEEGRFDG